MGLTPMDVEDEIWEQIDSYLSRSAVLRALMLYRKATGAGIREAKAVIGTRFREKFPALWATYRQVTDDE
jgi:hypothetical protein